MSKCLKHDLEDCWICKHSRTANDIIAEIEAKHKGKKKTNPVKKPKPKENKKT